MIGRTLRALYRRFGRWPLVGPAARWIAPHYRSLRNWAVRVRLVRRIANPIAGAEIGEMWEEIERLKGKTMVQSATIEVLLKARGAQPEPDALKPHRPTAPTLQS